jgi:putative MATE family efflux protein
MAEPAHKDAEDATPDRTEPRWRRQRILGLAAPIIAGMLSQNLLNLVDTAMVGRLGNEALAATGLGGFAFFMAIATMMGLSAAVQAMAARRIGEGKLNHAAQPLNSALLLALVFGVPFSALLIVTAPHFFPMLNGDAAVSSQGIPYLQARFSTLALGGMTFAFRGYFNGVDRPIVYMRTLLITHAVNIVLNFALIFGMFGAPKLGVLGAGIGSAIATCVAVALYVAHALREALDRGFLRSKPSASQLRVILRIALPASAQQFLFAAGLTVMFWIIGLVGTAATAAASVLVNVMLVAILPGVGMGLAAATLVGQALGRGDPADAKAWGWDVARLAMILLGAIGLLGIVGARPMLGLFILDAATIDLAVLPLRLFGAVIGLDCVGLVLMNALLGAGASRIAMQVSVVTQWVLFLPVAYLLVVYGGFGLLEVWIANAGYRLIQAGCFAWIWHSGSWQRIKV